MRRALIVASIVSAFVVSCSDDENRARPVPSAPADTGLPIVEAGGNDTGTPNDTGGEDATTDSTIVDGTVNETSTDTAPMEDAMFSDIPSTKDTAVDAIILEAGGGDAPADTGLPDALGFFDTAGEDVDAR